jgi:hypothetical protein
VIRAIVPLCYELVCGRIHFDTVRIQNMGLQHYMIGLLEEDKFERS